MMRWMRQSWLYFIFKLSVGALVALMLVFGVILVVSSIFVPSSQEMAFMARQSINWNLYVADLDRQLTDRVTFTEADDRYPAWSPDGKMIAFHSNRDGQIYNLYIMDNDGRNVRRITTSENMGSFQDVEIYGLGNAMASWSPDGKQIAFHSDLNGDWDLYLFNVADGSVQQLTNETGDEVLFAWSPDGKYGLFSMGNADNVDTLSVYMMDMETRNIERLTFPDSIELTRNETDDIPPLSATATALASPSTPVFSPTPPPLAVVQDWHPSWSPDGNQMVFASERDSYYDNIFKMHLDNGEIEVITSTYYTDHNPIWSRDGQYIVFASDRNIVMQIFAYNVQDGTITQITHLEAETDAPAWRPN